MNTWIWFLISSRTSLLSFAPECALLSITFSAFFTLLIGRYSLEFCVFCLLFSMLWWKNEFGTLRYCSRIILRICLVTRSLGALSFREQSWNIILLMDDSSENTQCINNVIAMLIWLVRVLQVNRVLRENGVCYLVVH